MVSKTEITDLSWLSILRARVDSLERVVRGIAMVQTEGTRTTGIPAPVPARNRKRLAVHKNRPWSLCPAKIADGYPLTPNGFRITAGRVFFDGWELSQSSTPWTDELTLASGYFPVTVADGKLYLWVAIDEAAEEYHVIFSATKWDAYVYPSSPDYQYIPLVAFKMLGTTPTDNVDWDAVNVYHEGDIRTGVNSAAFVYEPFRLDYHSTSEVFVNGGKYTCNGSHTLSIADTVITGVGDSETGFAAGFAAGDYTVFLEKGWTGWPTPLGELTAHNYLLYPEILVLRCVLTANYVEDINMEQKVWRLGTFTVDAGGVVVSTSIYRDWIGDIDELSVVPDTETSEYRDSDWSYVKSLEFAPIPYVKPAGLLLDDKILGMLQDYNAHRSLIEEETVCPSTNGAGAIALPYFACGCNINPQTNILVKKAIKGYNFIDSSDSHAPKNSGSSIDAEAGFELYKWWKTLDPAIMVTPTDASAFADADVDPTPDIRDNGYTLVCRPDEGTEGGAMKMKYLSLRHFKAESAESADSITFNIYHDDLYGVDDSDGHDDHFFYFMNDGLHMYHTKSNFADYDGTMTAKGVGKSGGNTDHDDSYLHTYGGDFYDNKEYRTTEAFWAGSLHVSPDGTTDTQYWTAAALQVEVANANIVSSTSGSGALYLGGAANAWASVNSYSTNATMHLAAGSGTFKIIDIGYGDAERFVFSAGVHGSGATYSRLYGYEIAQLDGGLGLELFAHNYAGCNISLTGSGSGDANYIKMTYAGLTLNGKAVHERYLGDIPQNEKILTVEI